MTRQIPECPGGAGSCSSDSDPSSSDPRSPALPAAASLPPPQRRPSIQTSIVGRAIANKRPDREEASQTTPQSEASQHSRGLVIEKIKKKYDELFIHDSRRTVQVADARRGEGEPSLTVQLVHKLQSEPGRLFDKFDRAIITEVHAEGLMLQRMQAEPLSFGWRYSVYLWSAWLETSMQPAIAVVNYSGLHLYSWNIKPELLCHFGFRVEPHRRGILGWQCFQHTADKREKRGHVLDELYEAKRSIVVHVMIPTRQGEHRRAKVVMLTAEGADIARKLEQYAYEFEKEDDRQNPHKARERASVERSVSSLHVETRITTMIKNRMSARQSHSDNVDATVQRAAGQFKKGLVRRSSCAPVISTRPSASSPLDEESSVRKRPSRRSSTLGTVTPSCTGAPPRRSASANSGLVAGSRTSQRLPEATTSGASKEGQVWLDEVLNDNSLEA